MWCCCPLLFGTLSKCVFADNVSFPQLLLVVRSQEATEYQFVTASPPAGDTVCWGGVETEALSVAHCVCARAQSLCVHSMWACAGVDTSFVCVHKHLQYGRHVSGKKQNGLGLVQEWRSNFLFFTVLVLLKCNWDLRVFALNGLKQRSQNFFKISERVLQEWCYLLFISVDLLSEWFLVFSVITFFFFSLEVNFT